MSSPARVPAWKPASPPQDLPPGGNLELSGGGPGYQPSIHPFPFGDTLSSPFPLLHNRRGGSSGEQSVDLTAMRENGDVFLTWQDLWVFADGRKEGHVPVISGLTGLAQPGQILAIMGPSGCGKSTLLDALAGRLAPNLRRTGEILTNGRKKPLTFGTSLVFN